LKKVFLRQGDICLEKIEKMPTGLVAKGTALEIRGEREGHVHQIEGVQVFAPPEQQEQERSVFFVAVAVKTVMVHGDHGDLPVPPGTYRVTQFQEYQNPRAVD
jgi:hypothetical protein